MKVFLFLANFELDGMTSHKHDLAAKTVSNWRSFEMTFFRIASTLARDAKAESLLAIGEDKKVSFWSDLLLKSKKI